MNGCASKVGSCEAPISCSLPVKYLSDLQGPMAQLKASAQQLGAEHLQADVTTVPMGLQDETVSSPALHHARRSRPPEHLS